MAASDAGVAPIASTVLAGNAAAPQWNPDAVLRISKACCRAARPSDFASAMCGAWAGKSNSSERWTAAATTGPAMEPTPLSSSPTTRKIFASPRKLCSRWSAHSRWRRGGCDERSIGFFCFFSLNGRLHSRSCDDGPVQYCPSSQHCTCIVRVAVGSFFVASRSDTRGARPASATVTPRSCDKSHPPRSELPGGRS